jgi:transposase
MRTKGTAAELEARRRLAAKLLQEGATICDVMHSLDVSESSVKRWKRALREGGVDALAAKPHPGPEPKLDRRQQRRLVDLLLQGAEAAGFSTNLWTCRRVAQMIEREFGVQHHRCHVWRLLRQWKFSPQKPRRRARERNEADIERWRRREWPRIKKERRAAS